MIGKKGAQGALFRPNLPSDQVALHEPGKNLAGIVPGPQTHMATVPPAVGAVQVANVVALELLHGASLMVPAAAPRAAVPVTVTIPVVPAVPIVLTYFDPEPAVTSQPHVLSAEGKVVADWTVSVMVVRHADAASTTSETFALRV